MPMGWCPRPVSQTPSRPRNGSPRRESCSVVRHLFRRRMCGKRQCSRRNMRQMLTRPGRGEGSAPGYGVRVMGCARGRGRGKNGYRITLWSAGALPGKILLRLPGACCIIPARIRETVRRFCKLLAHSISAYIELFRDFAKFRGIIPRLRNRQKDCENRMKYKEVAAKSTNLLPEKMPIQKLGIIQSNYSEKM